MKIAVVTDNHAGCRNDSTIFVDYTVSFFTEQFIPYLLENKIDTVLHLGDVFDRRKYINFQTLAVWREKVFDVLAKHNIRLIITVGNHDVYYKNTNEINSVFELLRVYPNVTVYSKPLTINLDGLDIMLLPWIPQGAHEETFHAIKETKAQIAMGHLEIKGFAMHAGMINTDHGYDADVFQKFDMVLTGHFHHRSSKDNIFYLGSPYQITWNDWGDVRGFHIFDTTTRELLFIENTKQIFKKIYYNDEGKTEDEVVNSISYLSFKDMYVKVIVERKDHPQWYEQFIQNVYDSSPADVSIVEQTLYAEIQDDEFDNAKDTLTILKEYVQALDIKDKENLNDLLSGLYHEALTLDIE